MGSASLLSGLAGAGSEIGAILVRLASGAPSDRQQFAVFVGPDPASQSQPSRTAKATATPSAVQSNARQAALVLISERIMAIDST
ncbi:MAG: hypothetical protein H6934_07380 [Burkholderiaceae bacterium]|nr:hypothetical protein [Burkholderiaceae bacterium]